MKKYVLTTIVASVLGCSLLLAEDTTTQQTQPVMAQGAKMACGKMKCKSIEAKAEKAAANFNAKAVKANKRGVPQLADLYTNCANAQQKVADAAKAADGCMQACKANKDAAKTMEMNKQCEQVCGKLTAAQDEAAQANKALSDYKKSNKKANKDPKQVAPVSTESPS